MKVFEKIVDDLSKPREVTRIPGKVGSVLPRYSKINKDEIIGYVLDMKMPKARGKSKGRFVEYFGVKEYGNAGAAEAAAKGQYQKIIMDPKYRELMTDRLLVDRDAVVRSFLNHLENVSEFDGYEKIAPELKYLRASDTDHQYEKINKYFRGWVNGDFEVEGIDRKNLTKQAKKEIKNWSPQARGERTKVRQERMQFLDELNNQDIPLTKVKKEFKKKFGKGKYYNDGTFASTINQFTQLKREGSLPSNADGSKTLNYGVSAGERSPWLKQALAENVQFSSNYNRLISAADDARAKGNLTRAKNLEDTASRFFGTKGIFTRLPGNAEHPLSFTYGGKDNILKMDSLVRGDLNQTKKVLFDNPIRDLSKEYNLSTTTAKRKKQIRDSMINRKAFMNYLTSGSFDKGMAQSVNFDFTPNKVYLKSTVTPLDKLPKGYDFKKFVKKGEGYSKAFEKYGGDLGMVTKSGFSKRIAIADDNLKKIIAKLSPNSTCAVFRKPKAEGGGVSGLDQCFEEGMQALKDRNISKPHQVQATKQLMNAGKRIGASTFARRLLDLGILGEVAFIAGDTGIRMAMGRPFSEAFKAATFREGQADKERQQRAGFTEREMLIGEAQDLSNKALSLQQQIAAAEAVGDEASVPALEASLKNVNEQLQKTIDPAGTKLQTLLTPTSATNIEATRKLENIIDADRAKSLYTQSQLRDVQEGVPGIADYAETETPTMQALTPEREVLPGTQEYLRGFMRQSLPESQELEDRTIDRFVEQLSPMEKFELEVLDPRRSEILYGTQGKFAEGGLTNLTRTIPPESGPNAKGLESLRRYATRKY
jgi:hypothetical protein